MIECLKYRGWSALGLEMGVRLRRLLPPPDASRRVLVPVPLAPERFRERGYNQSEAIARGMASPAQLAVSVNLLSRVRNTPTQTQLSPERRRENVTDAFRVDPRAATDYVGCTAVLVDDVVTTGATLNACAAALGAAGFDRIGFITFGRARDPRDAPIF